MNAVLMLHNLYQLMFTIVMIYLWRISGRRVPGLDSWTLNLVCNTAGLFFTLFFGESGGLLGIAAPPLLATAGGVFFYRGLAAFTGRKSRLVLVFSVSFILVGAGILGAVLGYAPQIIQIIYAAAFIYLAVFYLSVMLPGLGGAWYRGYLLVLSWIYIVIIGTQVLRIGLLASSLLREDLPGAVYPDAALNLTTIASRVLLFVVNFLILVLINRKLTYDLECDAVQKEQMIEKMQVISETDSLTGLLNRMSMDDRLDSLASSCRQGESKKTFGIMLIDVDDFKSINDTYGHDAGDEVLREVSELLREHVRNEDTVGRWGGDEFLIIAADTNEQGTRTAAVRIAEGLHQRKRAESGKKLPTVSIGYAVFSRGDTSHSLIKRADVNMYKAKKQGKDQIWGP